MGRRLIFAALWLVAGTGGTARADWQVHRDGTRALLERAEQAFRDSPDDEQLARRLVQLAGRRGATELRDRFRARVQAASTYPSLEAYAQLLLALGDAPAAAAAFDESLRRTPEAPSALAGRARALARARSPETATAFDEAIAHERRPAARRRLIEEALALVSEDAPASEAGARGASLDRVVALRRELVRLAPENGRDAEGLADALARAGKPAEAAEVLERLVPPDRPLAKLPLEIRAARLRLADHDPADAARADERLRHLLDQIPPGAVEDRRAVWTCLRDVARTRGTLSTLADELARAPGPVEWDLLGQIREELGDLEGARTATAEALRLAPRDAALGRRLLGILDRLGRDDEALAAAAGLARQIPSDVGLAIGLADRQLRRGDRTGAGATFDQALKRFSFEPSALESLAEAATRWGEDKRALAAWTRLVRVDPQSEVAIVGLGEAQFQAGKRDDARRTWSRLRGHGGSAADGHQRLGQLLYDHDLVDDALAEARRAEAAAPTAAAPHRLLAQIAERERRVDDAVAEWRQILALARDPRGDGPGLRREARLRLLTLLAHQGRGRLEGEIHHLEDEARAHPDDVDTATFLAEAEQRLGDTMGAIATLREIAGRGAGAGVNAGRWREAAVDAELALARLLKQTGQLDEAASRLGELARLSPERAREAEFQIAEIALGRYDVKGALAHAAAAEKGADAAQLTRIAELRERAGDEVSAAETYRAAIARGAPPTASLALARILERQGDAAGAASVLEALLRTTRDDAAISDAVRVALGVEEALGRLPTLVDALLPDVGADTDTPARRRALVDVLAWMLPMLARNPADDAARIHLGRTALRPLLDLVVAEVPDRRAIELLGLLGNADAVPALVRLASHPPDKPHGQATIAAAETRQAALIALGRIGDPRGLPPLAEAATTGPAVARTAAVWALGRIADERVRPLLWHAVEDPRPDIQALACLGLGRDADARAVTFLARLAADGIRPIEVRRAAALALGRAGGRESVTALVDLVATGDDLLPRAAATALAWTRDPRALSALLTRALLSRQGAAAVGPTLGALEVWLAGGGAPDEARAIAGSELAVTEILAALSSPPPAGDLTPLLRDHVGDLDALLLDALTRGGNGRRAALDALDARNDGPGLGALVPAGPLPAATQATLREITWPLGDAIAASLDDPDQRTRATALRLLAKLDDERLTPARLAEAVADGGPALAEAAVAAARILVRAHPTFAAAITAAIAPLSSEDGGAAAASWSCRLAAVEILGLLGPAGLSPLDRAANDRNPLVRAAALEAIDRARAGVPSGPSG